MVKEITHAYFPAGDQSWSFERAELTAGIYIVQVVTKDAVLTEKIVVLD